VISRARIALLERAVTAQVVLRAQHLQIRFLEYSLQANASVQLEHMTMDRRIVQVIMFDMIERCVLVILNILFSEF
jgi:hypothetical protein